MPVFVDTNVLVRIADAASPEHSNCLRSLQMLLSRGETVFLAAQIMIEFWAVATRPVAANGLGWTVQDTDAALTAILETTACLAEPHDMAERWRRVATLHSVAGKSVHDARVAALMDAHGVTQLLTLNASDFKRYALITCLSPADVVAGAA
jgi:predicted nucleic acid-binding protein